MSDIDAFVVRGHEKVIAYYRWLRDTAQDASERAPFGAPLARHARAA